MSQPLKPLILPDNLMSMNAESILKVIGNPALPLLDILLRESIQNSLDAGLKNKPINVDFDFIKYSIKKTLTDRLSEILGNDKQGVYRRLAERINLSNKGILTIRDIGTTGLDGPASKDDKLWANAERKNFFNLVFNIGRNHGTSGAGGSFGFGKTIFFKAAESGLVLYYSKCLNSAKKEEHRLMFCMISKEEQKKGKNTGIIWWGGEHYTFEKSINIRPLTGSSVLKILKILDIKPFDDSETGTLIGIVSPKKDLIYCEEDGIQDMSLNFSVQLADELSKRILKWYWSRMLTSDKSKLKVRINDVQLDVSKKKILKPYGILLKAAENLNKKESEELILERYSYLNDEVVEYDKTNLISLYPIKSTGPTAFIGTLALMEIPSSLGDINDDYNNVIAMIRKPLMVVYYSSIIGIPATDNKLIGVFLVNSSFQAKRNSTEQYFYSIDDAFRFCEDPAHNTWNSESLDPTNDKYFKSYINVAKKRIKKHLEAYYEKDSNIMSEDSIMSIGAKKLGSLLMMSDGNQISQVVNPINYGNKGGSGSKGGNSKGSYAIPQIKIKSVDYSIDSHMLLNCEIDFKTKGNYNLNIAVLDEGGNSFIYSEWIKNDMQEFPFEFSKIEICDCLVNGIISEKKSDGNFDFIKFDQPESGCYSLIFNLSEKLSFNCKIYILIKKADNLIDLLIEKSI